MYRADETLYLLVKATGRKSWIQRFSFKGRRHDIGLGPAWAVSLKQAREIALENRIKIYKGLNPMDERSKPVAINFKQAAIETHRDYSPTWSTRHASTWMQMLDLHAMPKLGNKPVDTITQSDV